MRHAAIVSLFLFVGLAVHGQDGKPLFRTLRVGMKVRYKSTMKTATEAKGDWKKSGGERTKGKEKTLEVYEREWTETVLGIKQGAGHLAERKYEVSTKGTAKAATMPSKPDSVERTGINGKLVYVGRGKDTVTLAVKAGTLQGDDEAELKLLEHLYALIPEDPVKTGQSWEPDATKVGKALYEGIWDDTNFKVKAKCTYKGSDKVAGRACARIQVAVQSDVAQFGEVPEVHYEYTGAILVSLESGVILGYDLTGPISLKGRSKDATTQTDWVVEGTRTMSLRGEVLEEGTELEGGTLEVPQ